MGTTQIELLGILVVVGFLFLALRITTVARQISDRLDRIGDTITGLPQSVVTDIRFHDLFEHINATWEGVDELLMGRGGRDLSEFRELSYRIAATLDHLDATLDRMNATSERMDPGGKGP